MRAWAVIETGKPLQEIELPTPEPTGKQVLLEITHAGVCHSDLHIWEGEYDLGSRGKMRLTDRGVVLPLAMGHEIVGKVLKWGPEANAAGLKVGDHMIVFPWVGCGKCAECLADEDNMCRVKPASLGVYQNGGYATHVLAPEPRHLVPLGNLDPSLAATYACSGITVFSAINKVMPMPPGEPIVLVAAAARNRRDAFAAAEFTMDHLKSDSWFWKREKAGGEWRWIEPRAEDHADIARW